MVQQRCTTSHAPVQHFDADERQVPMRFFGSVVLRSLEHRAHVGRLPHGNSFSDNRLKRPIVKRERPVEAIAPRQNRRRYDALLLIRTRPCQEL